MNILFYLHASIAVLAMGLAMFTPQAIHALLYTVFSLLNIAVSMYILSAPLAAALLAIIYAGAIMVLFVFVVMLIKIPPKQEKYPFKSRGFLVAVATAVLFVLDLGLVVKDTTTTAMQSEQPIKHIAEVLINQNGFLLEMCSFVLLAGLVTAIFIGARLLRDKTSKTLTVGVAKKS